MQLTGRVLYRVSAKLKRTPYAFGMTSWGPLPGTRDMHVLWDGPGGGLYLYARDPSSGAVGRGIRHSSAGAEYKTLREAERAVDAFVAVGIAADGDQESESASSLAPDRAEANLSADGAHDLAGLEL
jgi:hypothetical protein